MKNILAKIPAILAIIFSLLSFYFFVVSFIDVDGENWEVSVIVALFSLVFYFFDGIVSVIRVVRKIDIKFNLILMGALIVSVPMLLIFGQVNNLFFQILWNVYYLAVVALEIISIKRGFTYNKKQ